MNNTGSSNSFRWDASCRHRFGRPDTLSELPLWDGPSAAGFAAPPPVASLGPGRKYMRRDGTRMTRTILRGLDLLKLFPT